jgi:hypothetical protein
MGNTNLKTMKLKILIIIILIILFKIFIDYLVKSEISGTCPDYPLIECNECKEKLRISKLETEFYKNEFLNK